MSAEQLTISESELKKASLPGFPLTPKQCVDQADRLKGKVVVVTGQLLPLQAYKAYN